MLNKLLKYDLKYMIKNMSVFYIIAILSGLITRILFGLKQTVIVNTLGQIFCGAMFAMIGNILFNTIIRGYVIFKNSLYKDESYLTHTLPVTKTQIYESKFIQTAIFTLIGFLVIFLTLFIAYYTKERLALLQDAINGISLNFNVNPILLVIACIFIFYIEIINVVQCLYFGAIIGNRGNSKKSLTTFIITIVTYMLSQGFVILTLFVSALFNENIMSIFTSTLIDVNTIKLVFALEIIIYIIIITVINLLCNFELKKGVNVE